MNDESTMLPKAVINELLCIADTKWILGHWYIKVIQNGRSLTDFNALSAMSQDQLGHTRALFSLLEQQSLFTTNWLEFERSREQICSMQMLDHPPQNWSDFVVSTLLAELALKAALDLVGKRHPELGFLPKKCNDECDFHLLYLEGVLQELCPQSRQQARESLSRRHPTALQWFEGAEGGVEARHKFNQAYVERISPVLKMDLPVEPNVTNWDMARRRPRGSVMPATLWEFVLPTNEQAVLCRRPLQVSNDDNIRFTAGV